MTFPPQNSIFQQKRPAFLKNSLKLLAIGNEHTRSAMEYLWQICRFGGVQEIALGILAIPHGSLEMHMDYLKYALPRYIYHQNQSGAWQKQFGISAQQVLQETKWDLIVLQQNSQNSGIGTTYSPLKRLPSIIRKLSVPSEPHFLWHMTWAYHDSCRQIAFQDYACRQSTMYRAIIDALRTKVLPNSAISGIIPTGAVLQKLSDTHLKEQLLLCGKYLSDDYGKYIAGLTWFTALGGDPERLNWVPPLFSEITKDLPLLRRAVLSACNASTKHRKE